LSAAPIALFLISNHTVLEAVQWISPPQFFFADGQAACTDGWEAAGEAEES
jgi:hypothetical protein